MFRALTTPMSRGARPSTKGTLGPGRSLGTPGRACLLGLAVVFSSLLATCVGYGAFGGVGGAIHTLAHETAPSVVAALHARSDIAAMDAEALDDALFGDGSAVGTSAAFSAAVDAARRDMETSAENVTFGEAERAPLLEAMRYALSDYQGALGEIRGLSASATPHLMHTRTLWASRILSGWAIPAAIDLEQANLAPLEVSFDRFMAASTSTTALVLGSMGMFDLAVGATQLFAFRRLGGTAVTTASFMSVACVLVCAVLVPTELSAARSAVHHAKTAAFDSVISLNETRAALDRMNALESLWLLVTPQEGREAFATEYDTLAAQMLRVEPGQQPAVVTRQLVQARELECAGHPEDAKTKSPVMGGFIGTALDNITFGCAERTPVTDATIAIADYLGIDRRMRDLETHANHAAAIVICTGDAPGQSNWAFKRAQVALTQAAAVNDAYFIQDSDQAQAILARMGWLLGLLVGAGALLQCLDLWIRTKDYR
jgi:hypothetical protein